MSPSRNTVYGWNGAVPRDGELRPTRHLLAAPDRHAAMAHPETPLDVEQLQPTNDVHEQKSALAHPHQHLWRFVDQPGRWINNGGVVPTHLDFDQPEDPVPPQQQPE